MAANAITKTGNHKLVAQLLMSVPKELKGALDAALAQEGLFAMGEVKRGIVAQAPGGVAFTPLAATTLKAREVGGAGGKSPKFGGSKALIVTGELLNAITSVVEGGTAFVGLLRTARSKNGKDLANLGTIHEYGAGPTVIPYKSERQRRYVMWLMREAGLTGSPKTGSAGGGAYTLRIPARPFLRPTFQLLYGNATVARERFLARLRRLLPPQVGIK